MKTEKFNLRNQLIDGIRGFAVILMIFFHLSFDLNNFNFINIDILHAPFWYALPRFIVFLFLFTTGMSLTLVHQNKINWPPFWKRFLKLALFALFISIITYMAFPLNWIYFGTLHSIALISLISLPFLKRPKLSFVMALILFIPSIFFDKNIPWIQLAHQSWDYVAPFPWLGASLLGIFAIHHDFHRLTYPNHLIFKFLNFLGKHSLLIYLIHQPILFGSLYLLRIMLS